MSTTITAVVVTEEEKRAYNRTKLADALYGNEFLEASALIAGDLDSLSGRELGAAMLCISTALKQGGAEYNNRDWSQAGWAIYHQLKQRQNNENDEQVIIFLIPLINLFVWLKSPLETTTAIHLDTAEMKLDRAKPPKEWSRWALDAVERLMYSANSNPINDFMMQNASMTSAQSLEFIERLHLGIRDMIQKRRNTPNKQAAIEKEEAAKRKVAKNAARRARQLERAKKSMRKGR